MYFLKDNSEIRWMGVGDLRSLRSLRSGRIGGVLKGD
jgi:hypothetical protein